MTARRDAARVSRWLCVAAAALFPSACGDDPTAIAPECEAVPALVPGEAVSGALGRSDPVYEGAHIDFYGLRLTRTTTTTLTMSSTSLDPFLYLFGPGMEVITQHFAPEPTGPGELETASVTWTLEPGCHLVGASAWTPDTTGVYRLTAEETGVDIF